MTLSRRSFLRGLTASSVALLTGPSLLLKKANAQDYKAEWKTSGSFWGAMHAKTENGVVDEIKPFVLDQYPTEMLKGIKGLIYNPSRIRYPMVRVGWLKSREKSDKTQRGDNRFVRVTWDQALDLLYEELERVQTTYGPSGVYAGATGWPETGLLHRCTNHMQRAIGMHGNFVKKTGDNSTGAGQVILPYVLGSTEVYAQGTSWSVILDNSKTIVFWSSDPYKNLQIGWNCETHESYAYLEKLKKKIADGSIRVISVDPIRTKTDNYLNCEHQYVNPQTDVAFMLGIAHTLYTENLYDKDFIKTYALGFEPFIGYVMGETEDKVEKTPQWASNICGISPEEIKTFARDLVKGRTQLIFGWSIQRQQHGEQPYFMAAVLASMIGQIGLPGGGISYAHHYSGVGIPQSGAKTPKGFPPSPDTGYKPKHTSTDFKGASAIIPVARFVDVFMSPGTKINHNGIRITYPNVKMAIFSGTNPFGHQQDLNHLKKAVRNLDTIATVNYVWNATCRFSDIVLPACSQFERNDIDVYGSYSKRGVIAMHKLVDPLFHSKSDFDIFTEFCKRFGKSSEYRHNMSEMQWVEKLYEDCRAGNKGKFKMPVFASFWKKGYVDFGPGKPWTRHADFRADPEVNALGTPSGFIEITSRKIASFGYKNCPGHPVWMEKEERSHGGPKSDKYPLWLQSIHPNKRLHSQLCESTDLRNTYTVQGREPVYMGLEDAASRGIHDGDLVRVYNDRGQLLAGARISKNYPKGVICIHEGAWHAPVDASIGALDTYGCPNTLTLDIGTSDLAQTQSANTCVVEIEKFLGPIPVVNCFHGPIETKL